MINNPLDNLIKELIRIESETIKSVLFQFLGREADNEDAKKLTKVKTLDSITDYDLAYDGIRLGRISFQIEENLSVLFTPYNGDYSIMNKDACSRFDLWSK